MGNRKRKTRTHVPPPPPNVNGPNAPSKSFVVRTGKVSNSLKELVKDFRGVLEPNTGSRVRERKSNTLRDYISIAPAVGVTHLCVFSQPDSKSDEQTGLPNLRLTRLPRGPSLSFKVLRYSLRADIMRVSKRPHGKGREMDTEPILILSSFPPPAEKPTPEQHALSLLTTTMQSLFPPLKVHSTPLTNFRRVVLLSYNSKTRTIQFRHYLISLRPVSVSKRVRKLGASRSRGGSVIDLGDREDIADYILRRARAPSAASEGSEGTLMTEYASESETDFSESEAESSGGSGSENEGKRPVALPGDYMGGGKKGTRKAVGLVELGPRMELAMWKVDSGVVGGGKGREGETLWHEVVKKTEAEKKEIKKKAEEREKRREEHERKMEEKKKEKGKKVRIANEDQEQEEDDDDDDDADDSDEDQEMEEDDDDSDLTPIPMDEEDEDDFSEEEDQPRKKQKRNR
ncbi:Brix-domain-containing protein [Atractiella rhizophila]|nr:Brix-domain-containing protein [Atractiella rhizophila]